MTDRKQTPLVWPQGRPREADPRPGSYRTGWDEACGNIAAELRKLLGSHATGTLVIATDRTESNQDPLDPGVAAYFTVDGKVFAVSCDRWRLPEHNAQAIALILGAIGAACRHGAADISALLLRGLAVGAHPMQGWKSVLGFDAAVVVTRPMLDQRRREMAARHHPDLGAAGSDAVMAEINAAYDVAVREIDIWR